MKTAATALNVPSLTMFFRESSFTPAETALKFGVVLPKPFSNPGAVLAAANLGSKVHGFPLESTQFPSVQMQALSLFVLLKLLPRGSNVLEWS